MIKNKIKLCETPLNAFNVENVNSIPFYERYDEFVRVLQAGGLADVEAFLAQPQLIESTNSIEWYIPRPAGEIPIAMTHLTADELPVYEKALDALIARLETLRSQDKRPIDNQFIATVLQYAGNSADTVYCHDGQVVLAVWGMSLVHGHEMAAVITDAVTDHRVHRVEFRIDGNGQLQGQQVLMRRHGHIIDNAEVPTVEPAEGANFVKWEPDNPQGLRVESDLVFTAQCPSSGRCHLTFDVVDGGTLRGNTTLDLPAQTRLFEMPLPTPVPNDGYEFVQWEPAISTETIVNGDRNYTAQFRRVLPKTPPPPVMHRVHFNPGVNGALPAGYSDFDVAHDTIINPGMIPVVSPRPDMRFLGWSPNPGDAVQTDVTFTATYEPLPKKLTWYRRFWLWLTGSGCLNWLLGLIGVLLLLGASSLLLERCAGVSVTPSCCSHRPVSLIDSIILPDGTVGDNNGVVVPITGIDGRLPEGSDRAVAPVRENDGSLPPIESRPGVPDVFKNRLFLFLEDDNADVDALARDFKAAYPGDQYQIIGFDREVKLLVVQIPEQEHDAIKSEINSRLPQQPFIVFDEEVYEINGFENTGVRDAGWHLNAVHLKQGWAITRGNADVTVAVVDDGIDANHAMFKGRISNAYNVFTQNNHLSIGSGHGTHTAGLAAGSAEFYDKGAAGVAPGCQLMPVQVFDNGHCPMSALVAGIMYAVHHNADVVNVSVGPSFKGLNVLPVAEQDAIGKTQFVNVARLWKRVAQLAASKGSVLVLAAGNDDIYTSIPPENRNASSIVVTAVDDRRYPTDYTNYGPCSDISAPGRNILSAYPSNSFHSYSGTSMAAPIVAGTVALMKSLKRDLTVEQVRIALFNSGADVYGYVPPMVLVDGALQAVKDGNYREMRERQTRPVPEADIPSITSGGHTITGPPVTVRPIDVKPPTAITRPIASDSGTVTVTRPGAVAAAPESPAKPPSTQDGNYDEIRHLIRQYEKKIEELKRKLPENNK